MRSGARIAAVSRQAADPTAAAKQAVVDAANGMSLSTGDVTVTSSWAAGSTVTVSAQKTEPISIFGIPITSVVLHSATTERVE